MSGQDEHVARVDRDATWETRKRLRFDDAEREQRFIAYHAQRQLPLLRFAFVVGLISYTSFGVLDAVVAPAALTALWTIRYGVVFPILASGILATFLWPAWVMRYAQVVAPALGAVSGLGIVAMIPFMPPGSVDYYPGIMLVMFFLFVFMRVRFVAATISGWGVVVAYVVVIGAGAHLPLAIFVSNMFFIVAAGLIGHLACYTLERRERQRFLDLETIARDKEELAALNARLEAIAIHDHLTGLLNRRHLDERLAEAIALHQRYGARAALMLLDLDGFKAVNDRLGHSVGDRVLAEVARLLRASVRDTDLVFRYGGDEFCVLMPNTTSETSLFMGSRLLDAVRRLDLGSHGHGLTLGMSGGCIDIDAATPTPQDALAAADALLYRAKREGKGRVVRLSASA